MVTHFGLHAGQPAEVDGNDPRVTWDTLRNFNSGNVKVNITDISLSVRNPASGYSETYSFHHMTYEMGLYKRGGSNSGLVATTTLTKYWGQDTGFVTIKAIPAGTYSLVTRPLRRWEASSGSSNPLPGLGWCAAKFDLYHH